LKGAYPVWAGGHWKRVRHNGHLASGLPVLNACAGLDQAAIKLILTFDRGELAVLSPTCAGCSAGSRQATATRS